MENNPQTFANHTRYDPPFHFFVAIVFLINVIITGYYFIRALFSGRLDYIITHAWLFIVMLALLVAMARIRGYAIRVQDRVIRLEERLRLMSVLQEPLRSRIGELQDKQMVALRFASDEELSGLVQRALDEKLSNTDIKKAILKWRPDYSRV
ncbi:MAG TPA: DUF6526 family protein [Candidatus Angelobacter sp.]|jgi:hypothetical protein|nr:DUF6526 family protein [Candidatus Angelobacter sp.]